MPHIDDGTLHAWLDGAVDALAAADALPDGMQAGDVAAHLERCADCRARLEREREVRERAGLVLRDAAPLRVETPPLSVAPLTTRQRRAWLPLAWAASLFMAVGAGWWGSQIARDPRAFSDAPRDAAEQTEATAPIDALPPPAPMRAENLVGEPAAPLPAEDATAGRSGGERFTADDARSGVAIDAAAPPAVEEARRESLDATRNQLADAAPAAAGTARAPLGQAAGSPATAQADAASIAQAPPPAVPQLSPPPPPPPATAFKLRASSAAAPGLTTPASPALTIDAATQFAARDSAGLLQWTQVRSGTVPGIVDAEILSASRTSEIGAEVHRVTQRLGTGDSVQVLSWTALPVALQELVVTGERAPAQPRTSRPGESASAAAVPQASAVQSLNLIRVRPVSARAHELLFTSRDGWVLVRAPAWLDEDEVRARLGAVSVAPAPR